MICDRCNGKGHIHTFLDGKDHKPITCPKCRGKEDLDWIETIFGVNLPFLFYAPNIPLVLHKPIEKINVTVSITKELTTFEWIQDS